MSPDLAIAAGCCFNRFSLFLLSCWSGNRRNNCGRGCAERQYNHCHPAHRGCAPTLHLLYSTTPPDFYRLSEAWKHRPTLSCCDPVLIHLQSIKITPWSNFNCFFFVSPAPQKNHRCWRTPALRLRAPSSSLNWQSTSSGENVNCVYKIYESSLGNGLFFSFPNVWNCNRLWTHLWAKLRGERVSHKRLQHILLKHTLKVNTILHNLTWTSKAWLCLRVK